MLTEVVHLVGSLLLAVWYTLEAICLFALAKLRLDEGKGPFFGGERRELALVTGAGGELGRRLCRELARQGVTRLALWDVRADAAEEAADELRRTPDRALEARSYAVDITDREAVYAAAAKVRQDFGQDVTILVNNAGVVTGEKFLDCPDEAIKRSFDVNALAHCWMLKAFLPSMVAADKGTIITIASMAGKCGTVRLVDYSASKAAAVSLHDTLKLELWVQGTRGIRMLLVCPYFIQSELFAGVKTGDWFQLLNPDSVARSTIRALITGKDVHYIPWLFDFLVPINEMLPFKARIAGLSGFQILSAMATFKGKSLTNSLTK